MNVEDVDGARGSRHRGRMRSRSGEIEPGDCFVALAGDDVEQHIAEAIARGAVGVIVDAPHLPPHGLVRQVPGLRDSVAALMAAHTRHPSRHMTLVGVTGTNGKTTTVQVLAQAWHAMGRRAATIGTLGAGVHGSLRPTGLTTPPLVEFHEYLADFREQGVDCVAAEISSHALDQGRVEGCEFRIVAMTNITRDHLDYHGTMQEYAATKARILELPGVVAAVMNMDDPLIASMKPPPGVRMIGVSARGAEGATVAVEGISLAAEGAGFTLRVGDRRADVTTPLLGRFNVDNLAIAAGVLHGQGHGLGAIATALTAATPVRGRMQAIPATPVSPRVIVDYAHTPNALEHAVASSRPVDEAARPRGGGRLIVVFGCTGNRDRGKRPMMAAAAEAADVVIVTDDDLHGEDGDTIVAETLRGFADPGSVVIIRDRALAIRTAIEMARPVDTVLIAGKGHETTLAAVDRVTPFSDIEHAQRAVDARGVDRERR